MTTERKAQDKLTNFIQWNSLSFCNEFMDNQTQNEWYNTNITSDKFNCIPLRIESNITLTEDDQEGKSRGKNTTVGITKCFVW